MKNTDEEKSEFLKGLVKEYYTQGDSYHACKKKKNMWHFGYSNDYELQHGSGVNVMMPDKIVDILMNRQQQVNDILDTIHDNLIDNGFDCYNADGTLKEVDEYKLTFKMVADELRKHYR